MNFAFAVIPCAYFLDLWVGDPQLKWHPVRLIGGFAGLLDGALNKDGRKKKVAGAAMVILVCAAVVFAVQAVLSLSFLVHPALFFVFSVLLVYFSISTRALADEAGKIKRYLERGEIDAARSSLSMIVGRDTHGMDETQVVRATVETVAESTMDGIVAPLFYASLGGPALAWFYKAVNTMDSMVGHRNERYAEFGWAAAKLDGLLNFIPSKITAFLINAAMFICGKDWVNSVKWTAKYIFKGFSFNSDTAEAPMSGGLGVRLGGRNFYGVIAVDKPFLGDDLEPLGLRHIGYSIKVCYVSSALMLVAACVAQICSIRVFL